MATLIQTIVAGQGLCLACKHGEDCIYPRNRAHVALNCEQFELHSPMASSPPNRDQVELEELWKRSSRDEFKGLCSNCEERHACIYAKPAGGVWHCEEYR